MPTKHTENTEAQPLMVADERGSEEGSRKGAMVRNPRPLISQMSRIPEGGKR